MRPTENRSGMSLNHLQDRLHRSMQTRADFVPERSPAEIDKELARITRTAKADEGPSLWEPAPLFTLTALISTACAIIVLAGCVTLIAVFHVPARAESFTAGAAALVMLLRTLRWTHTLTAREKLQLGHRGKAGRRHGDPERECRQK
jgi:hypothetical protein